MRKGLSSPFKIVNFIGKIRFVSVPPDILDYPTSTDMVVTEGSNVTLRCAATGEFKQLNAMKCKFHDTKQRI